MLLGAGALAPRPVRASMASSRRFLFVHARGGWDPTVALLPAFEAADMEEGAEAAEGRR